MKGRDWVEAAVTFYEYWFFVSEDVREKLVIKAKEFENFNKVCGSLSEADAREYKRVIVSKAKSQSQDSGIEDFFLSDIFSLLVGAGSYCEVKVFDMGTIVKELLMQGFSPAEIIEIVERGDRRGSEKAAEILAELNLVQAETDEPHHCSGNCSRHCRHCSDHITQTQDLLEQVVKASEEEQSDVLIALLKKKGLTVPAIVVLTGLSEDQICSSKGFNI